MAKLVHKAVKSAVKKTGVKKSKKSKKKKRKHHKRKHVKSDSYQALLAARKVSMANLGTMNSQGFPSQGPTGMEMISSDLMHLVNSGNPQGFGVPLGSLPSRSNVSTQQNAALQLQSEFRAATYPMVNQGPQQINALVGNTYRPQLRQGLSPQYLSLPPTNLVQTSEPGQSNFDDGIPTSYHVQAQQIGEPSTSGTRRNDRRFGSLQRSQNVTATRKYKTSVPSAASTPKRFAGDFPHAASKVPELADNTRDEDNYEHSSFLSHEDCVEGSATKTTSSLDEKCQSPPDFTNLRRSRRRLQMNDTNISHSSVSSVLSFESVNIDTLTNKVKSPKRKRVTSPKGYMKNKSKGQKTSHVEHATTISSKDKGAKSTKVSKVKNERSGKKESCPKIKLSSPPDSDPDVSECHLSNDGSDCNDSDVLYTPKRTKLDSSGETR